MKKADYDASYGTYSILLTGSQMFIRRTVYRIGEKTYIIFYGQKVEVERDYSTYYYTVEPY